VELLKKIPEADQDPFASECWATLTANARLRSAVATYERALAKDPENQELRRAYAYALMDMGNTVAARTEFEKILKADPEDGSPISGWTTRSTGRAFDQARKELDPPGRCRSR